MDDCRSLCYMMPQSKRPVMLSFLPTLLLAYTCLVSISPPQLVYTATNQWKNIFILAGQSNMSGRGGITNDTWDGIVPPECRPNPSILRLTKNLTWEEAHEPLHRDIDVKKTCGIGPGMAFANAVLNTDLNFGVVGLVPCAIGGTNISEWQRGTRLYRKLVRRAEASLVDGGGVIRALLWYQGESDTVSYQDAVSYKGRLEKFISDLRADLQSPVLPVIQVALASGQGPYIETVREAQLGTNLPNVACVDAKGLPLDSDGLHLSTPAQVALASGEGKYIETVRRAQLGINLPNVKCVDAMGLRLKEDKLHLTTTSEVHLGLKLAHAFLASYNNG